MEENAREKRVWDCREGEKRKERRKETYQRYPTTANGLRF
jgi:hypothetical protein